ncbi:MAG: hypothetical protein KDJ37_10465 [Hyphomicrobiaceae bacterium]|nr:hypothetical protein [Hyphomicrobiaceae bacterium]
MRQFLSERYQQLLARQFRIRFPDQLSGLTPSVEKGVKAQRIVHWYDERARAQDKKPLKCCFGHPHGRGFVVEIEDGRLVLVGRDCAKKDFGFEFDEIVKGFEAEEDLQFQVRRLLAVRETLPAALAELRTLPVATYDDVWRSFTTGYGKAGRLLAKGLRSSQGRLIAYRRERNEAAEEASARRANKRLFEAWESADGAEQRKLAAEIRRFIDSREPIYKEVPIDMGPCDGWRFILQSERSTPARLVEEATALLTHADDGRPVEQWGKSDFARLRRNMDEAFQKLDAAADLVADLLRLTSPTNMERIADWAMQAGVDIRLDVPHGYRWPVTPALNSLRAAQTIEEDAKQAA